MDRTSPSAVFYSSAVTSLRCITPNTGDDAGDEGDGTVRCSGEIAAATKGRHSLSSTIALLADNTGANSKCNDENRRQP